MILSRVYPAPVETLDLDAATSRDRLLELYSMDTTRSVRLNMVTSVSGNAAGADGTSETLTSRSDRRILGVIRELSDVVLVGAASVRAEGYLLPRRSRLAILTSSGDLSGHRLGSHSESVIVLCPDTAVDVVAATLPGAFVVPLEAAEGGIAVNDALGALRKNGFDSIVCEGGPTLASRLLADGLVDELCLTTSPQLGGKPRPLLTGSVPVHHLTLRQTIIDEAGFSFARWAVEAS